jgi:dihydroflavonol-4-reductase
MTTVVTGAAGHVGSNLCVSLHAEGQEVRAVDLRRPVRALEHGARWVRADVRDSAAMAEALRGCEVVYHLAAVISIVGGLGGLVHSTNVDGVRVTAEAALASGARRFVHCSSVHAFDVAACRGQAVDEQAPRATGPRLPCYDRSKAAGEVELRRVIDRGLDAVILNPSGIIGPADDSPSRMGSVLLAMWRRRLPALVDGGFDWVDVRDVADALRAAAVRGDTGENYLVAGHRHSIAELAATAARVGATRAITRTVGTSVLRAIAPAAGVIARLTGTALMPTTEALHALACFPVVDGAKARRQLEHRARPIEETLADLHAFFVQTGALG